MAYGRINPGAAPNGVTREQALHETEFHANGGCSISIGPRGGMKIRMEVWRANGASKEWKRNDDVRTPIKHGMGYGRGSFGYVLWPLQAHLWHVRADCPVLAVTQATDCHGDNHMECTRSVCMTAWKRLFGS